jgi:hypothetical protein
VRSVAVSLDGVLRKPLDAEAQDYGGRLLFHGLRQFFRVVILGSEDTERDEHFLMINGMGGYVKIEPVQPGDGEGVGEQQRKQIQRLRAEGFHFEFVVIPDPDLAMDLLSGGVPVLLYVHPTYSEREHRHDAGGIRPWNELATEVESQLTARARAREEAT